MAERSIPKATLYEIPIGALAERCQSCRQRVFWIVTGKGRSMPVDLSHDQSTAPTVSVPGLGVSHFVTCPKASEWKGHHRV